MFKKNKNYLVKKEFSNQEDFEAKHNLFGFFDLLLKIDIRNNPHKYKKEEYEDNRNTNNTN